MNHCLEPELIVGGGAPIHHQVRDQIRAYVLQGVLQPGEELPTVRSAAVELAVNPHLIEQAYAELEQAGFVTTSEGATLVSRPPAAPAPLLVRLCDEFLSRAAAHGFRPDEVINAIQSLAPWRSLS
jgi:GntR family transcriptional regulator